MRRSPWPVLLALCALALPARGMAQERHRTYDLRNLAFQGVGGEIGWVAPVRTEPTTLIGARADLGYLGPGLRIVPRFSFWSSKLKNSEVERLARQIQRVCNQTATCPPLDLGEIRVSDLALSLDAQVVWETVLRIDTYAGVGGTVHLLNGQGEAIDDTFVEDILDAIAPGADLVAGAELPLGPVRIFGEGRVALSSDTRWVGASVGASVALGGGRSAPATVPAPPASIRTHPE